MIYTNLNPEKALIWRIVHRDNLPWILDNGLQPTQASAYVAIGNTDLISRRTHREVPIEPGGTLADYVPFYFTPFSPMMYNIYTGRGEVPKRSNEEICILVSSLLRVNVMGLRFVFTDRHAYLLWQVLTPSNGRIISYSMKLNKAKNISTFLNCSATLLLITYFINSRVNVKNKTIFRIF